MRKGFFAILILVLILMIVGLQYRLWFGEGSVEQIVQLQREIEKQKNENSGLQERNRALMAQIKELKEGTESIEAKARTDMGMIKEGETFYFITDDHKSDYKNDNKNHDRK